MKQKNIFVKDEYNKDMLVDTEFNNYQVMMEWERPYMIKLIEHLKPKGDVLEIGFGLGYSANAIQKYKIKSHTIIESDKNVLKKLKTWAKKQKNKVIIVEGFWQNELKKLKKFNSIFKDDAPLNEYPDEDGIRTYDFFYRLLKDHVNLNAKLTWFCTKPIYWISHPSIEWSIKEYSIDIPKNCYYIEDIYKKNKKLYLPLIKFINGTTHEIYPVALTNDFKIKVL